MSVSTVLAIVGGFILLYGFVSLFIKERLYLSEASIAIICGILFGPICAKFVDISHWGDEETITKELCRIVIGIQVMAAGVALPKAYLRTEGVSLLVLLGPVMTYMWLVSGLLVWALIPGLNFLEALAVAACFTPTDPILANSIVQGKFAEKHVAKHVRNIISCESGANDGLGYPFLFLAVYLLQMSTGAAIGKWFYWIMAFDILLSIVVGFVVGHVARKLLKYCEKKKWIDKQSFLVSSVALALFLMGAVGLMGSDDLLACFIAGNAFTWDDWFRTETEDAHLMEVVDNLLNLTVFVYIGMTMPWSLFNDTSIQISIWRLIVLAILVLLLRRLPIIVALYKFIPALRNLREALFTGWFGPIGVGAIYYYTVAIEAIPFDGPNGHAHEVLKPVVYFMVLASVVAHGVTIPLFYVGNFATRTLTRTSDAKITRNIENLPRPNATEASTHVIGEPLDDQTSDQLTETSTVDNRQTEKQSPPEPRHTAITFPSNDREIGMVYNKR
ncbi:Sodium/hydrogen exchanger family-domain-containing protein [Sporodiniella umbellata]|nr:Sodium/hydrogen exchanger family-domain-containing protein [Sporodiniella umbellata]